MLQTWCCESWTDISTLVLSAIRTQFQRSLGLCDATPQTKLCWHIQAFVLANLPEEPWSLQCFSLINNLSHCRMIDFKLLGVDLWHFPECWAATFASLRSLLMSFFQHVTIFIFWQTYSDQISHTASSERQEETCCWDVPEKETLTEMFMLKPVGGKHEYNKTPGQVHALLLSFQWAVKQNFLSVCRSLSLLPVTTSGVQRLH